MFSAAKFERGLARDVRWLFLLSRRALAWRKQVVSGAPAAEASGGNDPQFQSRTTRYKIAPGDTFDVSLS